MCLAKAYIGETEDDKLILEDVATVKIDGPKLLLSTLLGERREIEGHIKEIDFQKARLVLESVL